jgi:hypothetical protein
VKDPFEHTQKPEIILKYKMIKKLLLLQLTSSQHLDAIIIHVKAIFSQFKDVRNRDFETFKNFSMYEIAAIKHSGSTIYITINSYKKHIK